MSVLIDRTTFTAPTARIIMGGDEVGALQNINWTENTNLVRVKGIGSRIDLAQVDGFQEYEITASRAFLLGDIIVSLLQPIDVQKLISNGVISSISDLTGLTQFDVSTKDGNLSLTKQAIVETVLLPSVQAVSLIFDIQVQNNFGQTLFTFNRAKLTSRRASMSTGSVIMTEDVTILARYKSFPAQQLAQEIANISLNGPST